MKSQIYGALILKIIGIPPFRAVVPFRGILDPAALYLDSARLRRRSVKRRTNLLACPL